MRFLYLALVLLSACAAIPVKTASTCEAELTRKMQNILAKPSPDQAQFPDLLRALRSPEVGPRVLALQVKATCDFQEFSADPAKVCGEISPDSLSSCFKKYVREALRQQNVDETTIILSAATHLSWVLDLRKQHPKKSPLFWAQAMADYSLFVIESLERMPRYSEILGALSRTEPARILVDFQNQEVENFRERYLGIVRKLIGKMDQQPNPSLAEIQTLQELRARLGRVDTGIVNRWVAAEPAGKPKKVK